MSFEDVPLHGRPSRTIMRMFLGIPDYESFHLRPPVIRYTDEVIDALSRLDGPPDKGTTLVLDTDKVPWLVGNNFRQPVI
jgi:hypothetical protein